MKQALLSIAIGLLACLHLAPGWARAQAFLADDIVLLSKGVEAQEQGAGVTPLGASPGGGAGALGPSPGGRESLMEPPPVRRYPAGALRRTDVLTAASGSAPRMEYISRRAAQAPIQVQPEQVPLYGALELPEQEFEGPPNGLTLQGAIETLVGQNPDLRAKYFEIPQARADVLTAGLRGNPLIFGSASEVPYGNYSATRPGETNYNITVIQPFDVNHKRRARAEVAMRATRVLEAQFQDAVRLEIDLLYTAYVDVLAARETIRFAEASQSGLTQLLGIARKEVEAGQLPRTELDRFEAQREAALIGVDQAQANLLLAQERLAVLLNMPPEAARDLQLRGALHDHAASPPARADLIAIAQNSRPDLSSFRLGLYRARADVDLARREGFSDIFVLYSPYELRNNTPTGGVNATSWSLGAMGAIPLFNYNQGNIRRAELNVSQSNVQLVALERRVTAEVIQAIEEYEVSRDTARRMLQEIVPRFRKLRDASLKLYLAREGTSTDYLSAQRDYNDVVRQSRDAMIRHRRSMLHLNTVVGRRILP